MNAGSDVVLTSLVVRVRLGYVVPEGGHEGIVVLGDDELLAPAPDGPHARSLGGGERSALEVASPPLQVSGEARERGRAAVRRRAPRLTQLVETRGIDRALGREDAVVLALDDERLAGGTIPPELSCSVRRHGSCVPQCPGMES